MFQKYRLPVISFLLMLVVTMASPDATIVTGRTTIPMAYKDVQVHALLVIPSNDPHIGDSCAADSRKIQELLNSASNSCEVRVTIIEPDRVTEERLLLRKVLDEQSSEQIEISTADQVTNWIRNLSPKANDTILVYYTGHSGITESGSQVLRFDSSESKDVMEREELSNLLSQKPCRLKLLITDTDNFGPPVTEPLNPDETIVHVPIIENRIPRFSAVENLFLEHEGFLNLTAATEGEYAWISSPLGGGVFTLMLNDVIDGSSDLDGDGFLSWEEVFKLTRQQTMKLFLMLDIDPSQLEDLKQKGIKDQRPKYYGELPQRIKMKTVD